MKKYLLMGLITAACISTAAYAEGRGPGGHDGPGGPCAMMDDDGFDRPCDGPSDGPKHRKGPGMKGGFHGDPEHFKKKFNLNDDQVAKIDQINLKYKKEHLTIRGKEEPKRIELKKLLLEDTIDLKKVEAVLRDLSEYKVQSRLLMIRHRIEIESILTPEQKKKMQKHHD